MTDRFHSLTVVLDQDIRDDDAEGIINAIKHIKGVLDVKGEVADPSDYSARARVRLEMTQKLWKVLTEE